MMVAEVIFKYLCSKAADDEANSPAPKHKDKVSLGKRVLCSHEGNNRAWDSDHESIEPKCSHIKEEVVYLWIRLDFVDHKVY